MSLSGQSQDIAALSGGPCPPAEVGDYIGLSADLVKPEMTRA